MSFILSIGILTVCDDERIGSFLSLYNDLRKEIKQFNLPVQILMSSDNKIQCVGEKRNDILIMARGKKIMFIDDDDFLFKDSLPLLVNASKGDEDCVVFNGEYWVNGRHNSDFMISKDYRIQDDRRKGIMYRKPNHICPIDTKIAKSCLFSDKNIGEDFDYTLRVNRLIKTERKIDRKIYCYNFSQKNTLTQKPK